MCNNHQEYMYASRGPVSTMPGSETKAPEGMKCDTHHDRPATHRMQGETDSMGCEYYGLCDECYTAHVNHVPEPITGSCAWCKKHSDNLKPTRDFEEGLHGPVYDVCSGCRQRQNDIAAEELAIYDDRRDGSGNGRGFNDDNPDDDDDDDGFLHLAPSNASTTSGSDWQEEARHYTPPIVTVRSPREPAPVRIGVKSQEVPRNAIGVAWPFPTPRRS